MTGGPRRLWGSPYELSDLLEAIPGGTELAVRDFALITLAGQLSACFPKQLVFKGGESCLSTCLHAVHTVSR